MGDLTPSRQRPRIRSGADSCLRPGLMLTVSTVNRIHVQGTSRLPVLSGVPSAKTEISSRGRSPLHSPPRRDGIFDMPGVQQVVTRGCQIQHAFWRLSLSTP